MYPTDGPTENLVAYRCPTHFSTTNSLHIRPCPALGFTRFLYLFSYDELRLHLLVAFLVGLLRTIRLHFEL